MIRISIFQGGRAILPIVFVAIASTAAAQSPLSDLSIEELMKLDAGQVFGASERLQPVTEAPASVSFVTAEEIKRYGYRTLADILRSVRGMYVTDDRNFSLIGTRGFGKPGDYNSRILLLVNGHRVNDNVFGQAEIGSELGLDPAIFERVEIIRGPASSLYGDSAFFAVINVITRTGGSLGGGSIAVETGTLADHMARATVGHQFANGADLALAGTYHRSGGVEQLYFPAFDSAATNHGVAQGLDGEQVEQFYGRLDYKGLTVTGAYGNRRRDVPTASFGTLFNQHDPHEQTTDRHALVDAKYDRSFNGTHVTFRASYDRFSYDGIYPFAGATDDAPIVVGLNGVVGARWSAESGVTRVFHNRQTVKAGVEFIDNTRQDQSLNYSDAPSVFFNNDRASTQSAVYLQDEIKLARWLIVNAGLRYDGYEQFTRVTPRAALIILPSSSQSLKYLFGNAFRAPNAYELNTANFGDRVEQLRPESIDTHELVWERYVNDWLRTSVSAYWYKADRLITAVADPSTRLGISYVNQGEVRARGLELESQMRLKGGSRAMISYALQSAIDQETAAELTNSPRHVAKARMSLPLFTPQSFASVEAQYLSSRETLSGARVSPATIVNLSVIQPLTSSWELYGVLRNAFDAQYSDPASSQHQQDSIPQNGRTASIGLRYNLWSK